MTPIQILLINFSQILAFALAIAIPVYRVLVSGRFWASVGLGYLCFILWGFAVCLFLPAAFATIFHEKRIYEYFPDGPGAAGMLIAGWIPSLVLCTSALGLRRLWRLVRRSKSTTLSS